MFFASKIQRPAHISYECVRGDFDVSVFFALSHGMTEIPVETGRNRSYNKHTFGTDV